MILLEDLHEAGDRAQRRAQVVRHRIAERFELAVGRAQFRGPRFDAQLELDAAPARRFSAIVLNESASRPISSWRSISMCTRGRDSATASAASVTRPQRRGDPAADRPADRPPRPAAAWPAIANDAASRSDRAARAPRRAGTRSPRPTACAAIGVAHAKRARHAGALVIPAAVARVAVIGTPRHRLRQIGPRGAVVVADHDRRLRCRSGR